MGVVVLVIILFQQLGLSELWIDFGVGRNRKFIRLLVTCLVQWPYIFPCKKTYSRTCNYANVNDARRILFTQGNRSIENIPPTQDALHQRIKRSVYQAGYVRSQALERGQDLPNPKHWGWQKERQTWNPVWITIPEASKSCQELIHCRWTKSC